MFLFALLAMAGPSGEAHRWDTYVNPRFGAALAYPGDLFGNRVESYNGEGVRMSSADGASLAIFGAHNASDHTPAQYMKALIGGSGRYSRISYQRVRRGVAILSGTSGDRIFYERYLFTGDGTIHAFVLEYPSAGRARYDPLVARMSASLR